MKETIEVVAAVIIKNDNILATQRGYGQFKGKWEFPGGKIKENESMEDALKRKIKKELNTDIIVEKFLTTVNYEYPNFNLIMHAFICTPINNIEFVYRNKQELEHDNIVWLDKEDLDYLDWLPADINIVNSYKKLGG